MFYSPPKRSTRSGTKEIVEIPKKVSKARGPIMSRSEALPTVVGRSATEKEGPSGESVLEPSTKSDETSAFPTTRGADTAVLSKPSTGTALASAQGNLPGRGRGSRAGTPIPGDTLRGSNIDVINGTILSRMDRLEKRIADIETRGSATGQNIGKILKLLEDKTNSQTPQRLSGTSENGDATGVASTVLWSDAPNGGGSTRPTASRATVTIIENKRNGSSLGGGSTDDFLNFGTSSRAFTSYRRGREGDQFEVATDNAALPRTYGAEEQDGVMLDEDNLVNEGGSVEGEFRRVHFERENARNNPNIRQLSNRQQRQTDESINETEQLFNDFLRFRETHITPIGAAQGAQLHGNYNEHAARSDPSRNRNNRHGLDERSTMPRRGALAWSNQGSSDSDDETPRIDEYNSTGNRRIPSLRNSYMNRERDFPASVVNRDFDLAVKIGRIVANWRIIFPKTEKDPEQFLLILTDQLNVSGINKDMLVPYLSSIFEGAYRSWYILNKARWRTWKDFVRAFRFQWAVKKDDAARLAEIRDLQPEKDETLAEFTCRARIIFEKMRRPPLFTEQIRQILLKCNARLAFDVSHLPIYNYDQFLHFLNERSYLYQQSAEARGRPRDRRGKTDLRYLESYSREEDSEQISDSEDEDNALDLNVIRQKTSGGIKKLSNSSSNSKTLVKQRLEQNLKRFGRDDNTPPPASPGGPPKTQTKPAVDLSKLLCFNCGEKGHSARFCTAEAQAVCFFCREKGHKNTECIKLSGNDRAPQ